MCSNMHQFEQVKFSAVLCTYEVRLKDMVNFLVCALICCAVDFVIYVTVNL